MRNKTAAILVLISTLFAGVAGCGPNPEQRMVTAQDYMASNNYRGAMIELKSILQENPSDINARVLLAEVSLGMGDIESAEKELTKAFELGVRKADYLDLFFRIQFGLGRFSEILEQTNLEQWPEGAPELQRQLFRGKAFIGLRSADAAQEAFELALEKDSGSVEAITGLARVAASRGNYDEAVTNLRAALEADSANVEAWRTLGEISLLQGDKVAAQDAFSRSVEFARDEPDSAQRANVLAALADVQMANNELEQAGDSIAELAGIAPSAFITRFLNARLAFTSRDFEVARTELQQLLSDYPQAVQVEFLLAAVHAADGNLSQAEQHLVRVVAVAPDNIMARKMLARIQLQQDRPQQAVELLSPYLEQDMVDSELFAIAGTAKLRAGEHESAVEYLRQAVEASPDNRALVMDLAAALIAGGNAEEGLQVLANVPDEKGSGFRKEFLLLLARSKDIDQTEAHKEIDQFLDRNAGDVAAINLVGSYFLARKEFEQARKYLNQALTVDPNSLASLIILSRLELAADNLDEADKILTRLRTVEGGNLIGLEGLAKLAVSRGNTELAISLLQEARAGHVKSIPVRLTLARIYLAQGKAEEAVTLVDELLSLGSDRPEVLAVSGDVSLASGRARDALNYYKRWTGAQPDVAASYFGEARAYLALSENEAARRALEKATSLQPDWIPAATAMALLEVRDGRQEEALNIAERLAVAHPESAAPSILKGDIFMRAEEYSKAAKAYRSAFDLQPGTGVAIRAYQAGFRAGESAPQKGLETWLEKNPGDYAAGITVAEYYQRAGDAGKAIELYQQVLQGKPDDVVSLNNMAWALHQIGDSRSEEYARKAYQLRPDLASIADTLGWILLEKEQLEEGVKFLSSAANQAPNNREIQYHLAVGLSKTGKVDHAKAILNEILADPAGQKWETDAKILLDRL